MSRIADSTKKIGDGLQIIQGLNDRDHPGDGWKELKILHAGV